MPRVRALLPHVTATVAALAAMLPPLLPASLARADLALQRVADGLVRPVGIAATPADPDHIYVLEQWSGKIWRIHPATESKSLFFTVPGLANGYSLGLVGMAFHPGYAANGRFYVSLLTGSSPLTSRIREYTVNASGAVGSPRDILVYPQPHVAHNNAWIGFGPDGMLYIASGDGGDQYGGSYPGGNPSQRLDTLFGKILRIDVNAQDPGLQYRIPDGSESEMPNPFVGQTDSFGNAARGEVWLYGLRSPWRCSFDRLTGDLYIGDVGQFEWEWVHVVPAGVPGGRNLGWCIREGTHSTAGVPEMDHCQLETSSGAPRTPIHEYAHTPERNCIIGGYVYRGSNIPGLEGTYFFADNGSREVFSFRYDPVAGVTGFANRTAELTPAPPDDPVSPSSFGEDASGELYVISYFSGKVYKIVPECACSGDLNDDGQRNGRDIVDFVDCLLAPGAGCTCGDVNGTAGVEVGDVAAFVATLCAGTPCP